MITPLPLRRRAVFGPAGRPAPVNARLSTETHPALAQPARRERLVKAAGVEVE